MAISGKFLFDTSFDAPAQPKPEQPPAPKYGEAELKQAREEGHEAGRAAGRAEARAEREELAARTLPAVAQALQGFAPMCEKVEKQTLSWALTAALGMVRKLYPTLEQMQAAIEIEQMAIAALRDLEEEPRVALRLPDTLIEEMRPRLAEISKQSGFGGRLLLIADEALGPGDCRLEWADGGVERQAQRIWVEMEQRIARSLSALSNPSPRSPVDSEGDADTQALARTA
ncbi:flagellar assembly protein FliH [Hypericibacter adhaerens]|uniref:Flagellar assembly protein FliH n=1 Tax=Hypericibacter adhaerens TaxID=2602016 RepID=A0A5J6N427_9PROT|nr:FliH/SctL family protein [Hypericibacter adhaerens]QEX23563.1 flagellar assembly protein FliH [Hypericibacter adhaerens]